MKLLATLVIATSFFSTTHIFANTKKMEAKNGYLVKLKNNIRSQDVKLLSTLGIRVKDQISQLNLLVVDKNPLNTVQASADRHLLNTLIEYVEPNHTAKAITNPSDSAGAEHQNLFNYKLVNAMTAWEITKGSHDVIIGVSDSGVWDHGDLRANVWTNQGEIGTDSNGKDKSKNKIDDDGNGFVDDWRGWDWVVGSNKTTDSMYHGTHVAGTIGAVGGNKTGITGVAWKVSLMPLKFLDRDGSGTYAGGIGTLVYGADNGAKAINCSWGGTEYSRALHDAVEYAKSKGVLIVAAAGNSSENSDKKPLYPAAYDSQNVISVASVYDKSGRLSGFSNWGPTSVDIAAPGDNIYSTWNPEYSTLLRYFFYDISGTSMAAPHVSGAVALMYSANPNLNWAKTKDLILTNGLKAPKLKGKILSEAILDVGAAVKAATQVNQ